MAADTIHDARIVPVVSLRASFRERGEMISSRLGTASACGSERFSSAALKETW